MTDPTPEPFWLGLAKDWGIALAVVVGVFVVWTLFLAPKPAASGPAPGFDLPDLEGGTLALADIAEGPAVLNFWFTSCGPCRHEIPELARFHAAHPEVPLIGISVDRNMAVPKLAVLSERLGITYPVVHDASGAVARSYGVDLFPTTFVLHDGVIQHVKMGEVDQAYLEDLLTHQH
ncbi:MAG: cytochrome c biogenesis protein CcmG/thiol:disulfide interchange protein DsbE [Myxococcota bacterium]|jgi:cytochrome c biogenesis protein CcmG/thiol:disulfide interchange protein DsbE